MQHDHILKMFNFGLGPAPKSTQRTRTQAFKLKSRLICFISIAALPACKISAKILTISVVIAKLEYLTFDPLGGVKGGGVKKTLDTVMLIYRHLAIMVYSQKLLNIKVLMKCEDHHTKKANIGFAL